MSILELKNVSKDFGDKKVLKNINIKLNKNEIISILGKSGSGKTTLFNIISGLLIPDGGFVILNDKDITGVSGHISYMQQKDLLLPFKNIIDNASLPLVLKKEKNARETAQKFFKDFGLEGTEYLYPNELSGGMRQRVSLLRTYLISAEVALLDEPFSALDAITRSKMQKWYLDIMDKIKLSTIFISHDIDEAIMLSDRIYVLANEPGEIIDEIKIEFPKPRPENIELSEEFIAYKKRIKELL